MRIKPGLADLLWMAAGALALLALMAVVMHFREQRTPAEQVAFKARRMAVLDRMRLSLASASEAEKSAVMAITDEDSQTFADQARAAAAAVEQGRRELGALLEKGGTTNERSLLAQFSDAFAGLQRIDDDLLSLAVKNTNLKAYSLAFGPAAETIRQMDAALGRIMVDSAPFASTDARQVVLLAAGAQSGALRIQASLPVHIGEETDTKMDELEAAMANEDHTVRKDLDRLAALLPPSASPDLEIAQTSYARFTELEAQILKLSRENTNVRSFAISLGQKRKAMLMCQDALAALAQAIADEPIAGVTDEGPGRPR